MLFFGHTLCPEATPLTVLKMTRTMKAMKKRVESQYITCSCVFVTVKPDQDKIHHLKEFKDMFDPKANLTVLTADSNKSPELVAMLRKYKVPVGMTPEE